MQNKRHYMRYTVKCSGYITDHRIHSYRFQVNNISACGMNITTDREMKETNLLTIEFDNSGLVVPHTKQLKGFVVRKKVSNTGFNYAIRFANLSHTEIVEIDEYLRYRQYNPAVHKLENHVEDAYFR